MKEYGSKSLARLTGIIAAIALVGLASSAQAGETRQVTNGRAGFTTVSVDSRTVQAATSTVVVANRAGGRDGGAIAKGAPQRFEVAPLR